jgi:hypothetical protein
MKNLIIICLLYFSFEYIVIPFHYSNERANKEYNLDQITGKEFLELTTNKLVSRISVGTPLKTLELYLTMDYNQFFIGKGYCGKNSISDYEPFDSSTFKNESYFPYPFDDLRNMTEGNDTCTLYSNYELNTNLTLNGFNLLYGSKVNILNDIIYEDKVCGIMGFQLHQMQDSYYSKFSSYSLENSLKKNNVSNHTLWTVEFFNNDEKKKNKGYDGYLILGAGDQKYLKDKKNIDEEKIIFTYSSMMSNAMEWIINFKEISYDFPANNKTKMNTFLKVLYNFDLDYYFVTKEYFDSIKSTFFEPYLSQGLCKVQKLKEFYLRYQFITCDKSFNKEISKFPKLNLVQDAYNFTFQLTSEDCFKEVNNQVLFLLFYDPWSPDTFKVGKNFMQKYHFIFKKDQRTVGFLNFYRGGSSDNDGKTDKEVREEEQTKFEFKQLIWIVILLVLIIGIIIGVVVGKKIWDKNRTKRANELSDDDYVYETANKEMNNKIIN